MSRFDSNGEERDAKNADACARALNYALAEALDRAEITLLGIAIKWDAWECLLTLKGDIGGVRSVSFVASNNAVNAILKAVSAAEHDRLRWREDHYKPSVG